MWWIAAVASVLPGAWLLALTLGAFGGLGANPVERLLHESGQIAMIALLIALTVTPLRRLTGWNGVIRLRRMLGLFAFFYASVHVMIWLGIDLWWDFSLILDDLLKRPYIGAGAVAWLVLLALAGTSFNAAMRRLGKNWVRLHRLVYVAAVLALIHLIWLTRADYREAWIFGGVLAVLLGARVFDAMNRRLRRGAPARTAH
ncbi:MAG: sulfite oxidase heme-binding subunit YedZ [Thioalkalivibrionaceae bacterium]